MIDLKKALKLHLNNRQVIDCFAFSNDNIVKRVAYNQALDKILEFIEMYEAGDIDQDFLNHLAKEQENKWVTKKKY